MKKGYLVPVALLAVLAFAPDMPAEQVNFAFNGGGISSSGTFAVSSTSTPGVEEMTGITGTFSDTSARISGAITGLYTPVSYIAPPVGSPAFTTSGFSYDDTFYPNGDSPHNCADYPFFGGEFDVYGVAFNVAGGYIGALWSDGNIPGVGLVYAAGDSNATTKLNDPNPDGSDTTRPVGVPGSLVTSTVTPEPGSLFLLAIGLLGTLGIVARKSTAGPPRG